MLHLYAPTVIQRLWPTKTESVPARPPISVSVRSLIYCLVVISGPLVSVPKSQYHFYVDHMYNSGLHPFNISLVVIRGMKYVDRGAYILYC
jgi:hypothetical protein